MEWRDKPERCSSWAKPLLVLIVPTTGNQIRPELGGWGLRAARFSWLAFPSHCPGSSQASGRDHPEHTGQDGLCLRLPLLVSLSLMRKEPTLLIGASSCLSASFRLIDLKNHLEKVKGR